MNLVTNASEAIGEAGGVITISADAVEGDRDLLSKTFLSEELPDGTYVQLEVTDTGCGMTPKIQARIFDPFFSTKFTGRGLGLAAVLGIVRGIRGAIQVDSTPDTGSSFRVLIPSHAGRPSDVRSPAAATESRGEVETVLVVDDDEVVRSLTCQMLEEAGYEVLVAADGLEAIETFNDSPASVDMVLLDMTMPHMDGRTTFEKLRALRDDIPVIVSSGFNEQDAMDRFRDAMPSGFLQKPYRLTELIDAVKKAAAAD
jgi:CheY-like chemotaxis protein